MQEWRGWECSGMEVGVGKGAGNGTQGPAHISIAELYPQPIALFKI